MKCEQILELNDSTIFRPGHLRRRSGRGCRWSLRRRPPSAAPGSSFRGGAGRPQNVWSARRSRWPDGPDFDSGWQD